MLKVFSSRKLMSKMSQKISDDVEKEQNNQPEPTGKVELMILPGLLMNGSCP